jgi:hypothetical protein
MGTGTAKGFYGWQVISQADRALAGNTRLVVESGPRSRLIPVFWLGNKALESAAKWRKIMSIGRNEKCPCGSGKKFKMCREHSATFPGDHTQKPLEIPGGTALISRVRSIFETYHPIDDNGLRNVLVELKQGTIIIRPSLEKPNDVLVLALNEGVHLVIRHCHDLDSVRDIYQQLRKGLPGRKTVLLAEAEDESLPAQELQRILLQHN